MFGLCLICKVHWNRTSLSLLWSSCDNLRPLAEAKCHAVWKMRKRGVICAVDFTYTKSLQDIQTWDVLSWRFLQFSYLMRPLSLGWYERTLDEIFFNSKCVNIGHINVLWKMLKIKFCIKLSKIIINFEN